MIAYKNQTYILCCCLHRFFVVQFHRIWRIFFISHFASHLYSAINYSANANFSSIWVNRRNEAVIHLFLKLQTNSDHLNTTTMRIHFKNFQSCTNYKQRQEISLKFPSEKIITLYKIIIWFFSSLRTVNRNHRPGVLLLYLQSTLITLSHRVTTKKLYWWWARFILFFCIISMNK